jgi:acetolactate synthase-1/2/3 large subunit
VHIDIDIAEIDKNVVSDAHIRGDAKQALKCLDSILPAAKRTDWVKECRQFVSDAPLKRTGKKLCAREILKAINRTVSKTQTIATDVGQHQMWTAQSYNFELPRTFLTSGGLGTMGYGMGAAIGAGFATKKTSVLITGDGSFHMNFNELCTAVKYNVPLKIFVFNNNALGMVRQWQTLFYGGRYSSTTPDRATDYVKLADAFGAKGLRLESDADIEKIVGEAFSSEGTVIVDCRIDQDALVLPMIPSGRNTEDMITEVKNKK